MESFTPIDLSTKNNVSGCSSQCGHDGSRCSSPCGHDVSSSDNGTGSPVVHLHGRCQPVTGGYGCPRLQPVRSHDCCDISEDGASLAELECLLESLDEEIDNVKWLKSRLSQFEESYILCQQLIHKTADNLVTKIRAHEKRLLQEIETSRETEYRKLGLTQPQVDRNLTTMKVLKKRGQEVLLDTQGEKQVDLTDLLEPIEHSLQASIFTFDHDLSALSPLHFCPVRCNTSFATISDNEPATPGLVRRKERHISVAAVPGSPTFTLASSSNNLSGSSSTFRGSADSAWKKPSNNSMSLVRSPSFPCRSTLLQDGGLKQRRYSLQMFPIHPVQNGGSIRRSPTSPTLPGLPDELSMTPTLEWDMSQEGGALGEINCPNDVVFFLNDTIAISDRDNERIQILDTRGQFVNVIGQGKIKPRRLAITREGHIAVTDSRDNLVKIYDGKGRHVSSWGKKRFKPTFKAPCGIAVNSMGQFIMSDMEKREVTVHQPDGKLLYNLSNIGDVSFQSPSYVAVNQKDDILVSDNWDHCVKVFDKDGHFIRQFSQLHNEDNSLKYPNGLCGDSMGGILVADWGGHCVSSFDHDGTFLGNVLTRDQGLYHPAGVAVHDNLLVLSEYSETHSSVRLYNMDVTVKMSELNI